MHLIVDSPVINKVVKILWLTLSLFSLTSFGIINVLALYGYVELIYTRLEHIYGEILVPSLTLGAFLKILMLFSWLMIAKVRSLLIVGFISV